MSIAGMGDLTERVGINTMNCCIQIMRGARAVDVAAMYCGSTQNHIQAGAQVLCVCTFVRQQAEKTHIQRAAYVNSWTGVSADPDEDDDHDHDKPGSSCVQ